MHDTIKHISLGTIDYGSALKIQRDIHQHILETQAPGVLLSLEHKDVLTLGNRGNTEYLKSTASRLHALGIEVCATDRGGDITAHNPGQLVIYPILKLTGSLGPKLLVDALEAAVIATLRDLGITANRNPINPGVWVGNKKICSIGIRVHKRVSTHGLALNIHNDLAIFNHIVPCGLVGYEITRISDLIKTPTDFEQIRSNLIHQLASNLEADLTHCSLDEYLPRRAEPRMITGQEQHPTSQQQHRDAHLIKIQTSQT